MISSKLLFIIVIITIRNKIIVCNSRLRYIDRNIIDFRVAIQMGIVVYLRKASNFPNMNLSLSYNNQDRFSWLLENYECIIV